MKSSNTTVSTSAEELQIGTSIWDRVGLLASIICILHCTLTPVFIFFLPLLGQAFESPWVHLALAAIVFPVGFLAFYNGYSLHGHRHIVILALIGFSGLALGLILKPGLPEVLFTIAGGLFLSIAHILNLRGCRYYSH